MARDLDRDGTPLIGCYTGTSLWVWPTACVGDWSIVEEHSGKVLTSNKPAEIIVNDTIALTLDAESLAPNDVVRIKIVPSKLQTVMKLFPLCLQLNVCLFLVSILPANKKMYWF